jgi:WD40 repeat protein
MSSEEMPVTRFDAFISYSRQDRKDAIWLHKSLEAFRTPKALAEKGVKPRLGKVLRDEDELRASSDLTEAIREALRQSDWLIVVCSPHAAKSEWVNKEIQYFREIGRGDSILALLIDGTPESAFPPALIQPLAADTRPKPSPSPFRLTLRYPVAFFKYLRLLWDYHLRQRIALLRLLAPILDCDFDDLRRRDLIRTRRQRSALTAGISVLLVIGAFVWFQSIQNQIAELTAYSRDSLNQDPSRSILLSSIAFSKSERLFGLGGPLVRQTLELAIANSRLRDEFRLPSKPAQAVSWHPNGWIAAGDHDGNVRVWDRAKGDLVVQQSFQSSIQKIAFRPGTEQIQAAILTGAVTRTVEGITILSRNVPRLIYIWDLRTKTSTSGTLRPGNQYTVAPSDVAWCHDGRHLAASDGLTTVFIRDYSSINLYKTVTSPSQVNSLAWAPSCTVLAIGTTNGVYQWSGDTDQVTLVGARSEQHTPNSENASPTQAEGVTAIDWGANGILATGGQDRLVRIWGDRAQALSGHNDTVTTVAWSHNGELLASVSLDGALRIWTLPQYSAQYQTIVGLFTNQGQCWKVAWSPDDDEVATVGDDGSVRIWDVSLNAQRIRLHARDGKLTMDNDRRLLFNNAPLTTSELQDLAVQRTVRSLTSEECKAYLHTSTCPQFRRDKKAEPDSARQSRSIETAPASAHSQTTAPSPASASSAGCRYVILGPGDNIFAKIRGGALVRIDDSPFWSVDPTVKRFWFWEKPRRAALFVMKSYDPGPHRVYVRTAWRTDDTWLGGREHDHVGEILLDQEHTHYLVMPRATEDLPGLTTVRLSITPLSANEKARYLEEYGLSTPRCDSLKSGVTLVE